MSRMSSVKLSNNITHTEHIQAPTDPPTLQRTFWTASDKSKPVSLTVFENKHHHNFIRLKKSCWSLSMHKLHDTVMKLLGVFWLTPTPTLRVDEKPSFWLWLKSMSSLRSSKPTSSGRQLLTQSLLNVYLNARSVVCQESLLFCLEWRGSQAGRRDMKGQSYRKQGTCHRRLAWCLTNSLTVSPGQHNDGNSSSTTLLWECWTQFEKRLGITKLHFKKKHN